MTPDEIIQALDLPHETRIEQRVPKTLLVENGAPTAADKRRINEGVEELRWVAALKPHTVGIAPYRDDVREVVELAVLTLNLRPQAKVSRLAELVHRAIPYHLLLIVEQNSSDLALSLADKRWAQNEAGKTVLDGNVIACDLKTLERDVYRGLLRAMSLLALPRTTLYSVYRGWIDAVLAAEAARITGGYTPASDDVQAARRREALQSCAALNARIASLRKAAATEKQLARQVEMNLELKRLRAEYDQARAQL